MVPEYHTLEIAGIESTANDAVCVTFRIPAELEKLFEFIPGQHLTLRHNINDEKLRRFYSICSRQSDPDIRIAVRMIDDGRFSGFLNNQAKVGDKLEVLAPRGCFCLAGGVIGKHILALVSGSGITPVCSIIGSHLTALPHSTATLVYGNRNTKSIMLRGDINDLKDAYLERFQIIHMLSREQRDIEQFNGRIDKASIFRLARALFNHTEPFDGPNQFICKAQFAV